MIPSCPLLVLWLKSASLAKASVGYKSTTQIWKFTQYKIPKSSLRHQQELSLPTTPGELDSQSGSAVVSQSRAPGLGWL